MTAKKSEILLFTIPKAFRGGTEIRQRNAIKSWKSLGDVEVLLCGDDPGVAETAKELGCNHVANLRTTDKGTPLLSDAFDAAAEQASNDILCYANADIIFLDELRRALTTLSTEFEHFFAVSQCTDLSIEEKLDFEDAETVDALRRRVRQEGSIRPVTAMDYFCFTRKVIPDIPDFAVGRAGWDIWMMRNMRKSGVPVIDLTPGVPVVHQRHDYTHLEGEKKESRQGKEAQQNIHLLGGLNPANVYTISDATHQLKPDATCVYNWGQYSAGFRRWSRQIWGWFLSLTRPVRHPLGLRAGAMPWNTDEQGE